jgi:hypothetical protein
VTSNQRTNGDIRGQVGAFHNDTRCGSAERLRRVQCCRHYDCPRRPALLESQPIGTVQVERRVAALEAKRNSQGTQPK